MSQWQQRAAWTAAALVVGIGAGIFVNHRHSLQSVSVTLATDKTAKVYNDTGGDGPASYSSSSSPLYTLSSSQTIQLRAGVYDAVVADPSHEYENPAIRFTVTSGINSVDVEPNYTTAKLTQLLGTDHPAIVAALTAKYPTLTSLYSISAEGLYEEGDWYGAVLSPTSPANDRLRVILQKDGGTWKVVTAPPLLTIGRPSYPNIPAGVLTSVDQLGT